MKNVFEYLDNLSISYQKFEHRAVFTCAESENVDFKVSFGKNKNLFLTNKKGTNHYLVTLSAEKQLDLKKLSQQLEEQRLRFASPERLKKYLDLTPGSVSPFGLINDKEKEVKYMIDSELLEKEYLGFHPNINTQTLIIRNEDFQKYLKQIQESYEILTLE